MNTIYTSTKKALSLVALVALMITGLFTESMAQTWTIGTGIGASTTTGYPCVWGNYYWGARQQFIYRATELTAAGMTAGTISQIGWESTALNNNVQPNFTISLKNSATGALTAWETGMTLVYGPANFTAGAAGWKDFTLGAFSWDGTSNIIVEVCVQGTGFTNNVPVRQTTLLPANTSRTYRADAAGVCASSLSTAITTTTRPNARFIRLSGCVGTPNNGTATGPSGACTGANFTVSATGLTTGSGIGYNWQRSTDGGTTWNNIAAATSASAVVSQTVATQYRIFTLCTPSGLSAVSNVVSVAMSPFWACYCSASAPPYGGATSVADEDLGNVTVVGQTITLNNTTTLASPASTAPGTPSLINQYQNYTNLATVPDLGQSATYNISLTSIIASGTYTNGFKMWIDFNQDGDFDDAGEEVYNSPTALFGPGTQTGTITIPGSATLGITGMLVKNIEQGFPNANLPCASTFTWGEAELYRVNIIATPPCSGTPSAGTASGPAGLVCSFTNIALSATGLTQAPGISYQWQANNATLGGWTNLPAGGITVAAGSVTSASVTVTGQSENTQYRIYTLCTPSGLGNNSNTISLNNDVATNCYCIPTYTNAPSGDFVNSVTLNTLTNLNSGQNTTAPYFTLFTAPPANLTTSLDIGAAYDLIVQVGTWTSSNGFAGWIDFNADGDFNDAGEKLGEVTGLAGSASATVNFTVPPTAVAGVTRLRVREVFATSSISPCTTYGFGETEDYFVTLAVIPNCSAAPTGGTAVSSVGGTGCTGIPFNLTVTGSTTGVSGLAYQWQRNDGAGWIDIAGGNGLALNGFTYSVSDPLSVQFRRRIVCTNTSDTSFSSAVTVARTICYCATSFTSGNGAFFVSRVRVEGGTLDNTTGGIGAAPAYANYTDSSFSANASRSAYYWLRLNSGTGAGIHYYGAWADWNQDGDFVDAGENLMSPTFTTAPGGTGAGGVVNALFQVPVGATLGTTRMRIRVSGANPFAFLDPCTNYVNGETEDYKIQVGPVNCPAGGSVAGNLSGVTPTFTTNNDVVTPTISGGDGTLIRWEFSFDDFATAPAGSFAAYPNPAPFIHLLVNPNPFTYVRAVYQNEGCPVANSNVAFVKTDCAVNITQGAHDNDNITNVRLRTLPALTTLFDNNSTVDPVDPDSYQNFKTISADIERGKQYELRVTPQGNWSEHVAAWIDFNGDGTFQNNEMCARSTTALTTAQTFTITVPCSNTNPANNYIGPAVLRVMTKFSGTPIDSNACTTTAQGYGEIEEYSVDIQPLGNLTVTPPNAVCVPAGGSITVSGGTGTYTWAPATGISATTGTTITVNNIPTLQFYTVTGTQAGTGCAIQQTFAAATLPIGGNATPASSVVCSGTARLFTATGTAGNLQWQTASSATGPWTNVVGATNNTFNLTNITATTFVRVIASSSACFDISSTTAVVSPSSTPIVSITNVTSTSALVSWTPFGPSQYNIAWTGAGTGSQTLVTTNNFALSGLTPNTNLNVTVTLNTPTCVGTSPGTATTKTLCAKPTGLSLTAITQATTSNKLLRATWTAVGGATSYRIYYRNMNSNAGWAFVDTTGGTVKTLPVNAAPNSTWAVYVAVNNCPSNPTALGDVSTIQYIAVPPLSGCSAPTFTAVSNCPNQLSITGLSGSPTGNYRVSFRRIFPSFTSSVTYQVSSPTFNISIGSQNSGSVYEVYVQSVCTGPTFSENSPVQIVEVKPACPSLSNPLISAINCFGGTISWNPTTCVGVTGYYMYIKKTTATAYSAYPTGGLNTYRVINFLTPNTAYNIYVSSVSCNGYISPASSILTFTTGGPGCREEEAETVEAVNAHGEGINIFPNPTDGNFSVSVNSNDLSAQEVRIEVMNAIGQIMVTNITNMTGGNLIEGIQLDNSVASGVYFVRVHVGKNVYVNRLVLSRD
ncbi:hypothetical protein LBMAG25_01740 [Bacteroidota bacterium]|nr:hypothetical protein LBMAG25_01740 [Bacteroidota bacterium]